MIRKYSAFYDLARRTIIQSGKSIHTRNRSLQILGPFGNLFLAAWCISFLSVPSANADVVTAEKHFLNPWTQASAVVLRKPGLESFTVEVFNPDIGSPSIEPPPGDGRQAKDAKPVIVFEDGSTRIAATPKDPLDITGFKIRVGATTLDLIFSNLEWRRKRPGDSELRLLARVGNSGQLEIGEHLLNVGPFFPDEGVEFLDDLMIDSVEIEPKDGQLRMVYTGYTSAIVSAISYYYGVGSLLESPYWGTGSASIKVTEDTPDKLVLKVNCAFRTDGVSFASLQVPENGKIEYLGVDGRSVSVTGTEPNSREIAEVALSLPQLLKDLSKESRIRISQFQAARQRIELNWQVYHGLPPGTYKFVEAGSYWAVRTDTGNPGLFVSPATSNPKFTEVQVDWSQRGLWWRTFMKISAIVAYAPGGAKPQVVICTSGGLFQVHEESKTLEPFWVWDWDPSNYLRVVGDSLIWVVSYWGSESGVHRFSPQGGFELVSQLNSDLTGYRTCFRGTVSRGSEIHILVNRPPGFGQRESVFQSYDRTANRWFEQTPVLCGRLSLDMEIEGKRGGFLSRYLMETSFSPDIS
ncbi:MAG: hypothetical protein O2960_30160 [Verrucomicrobia bacterium]|nr:hypothetical protein [Verrucomicrobiota bacterium]